MDFVNATWGRDRVTLYRRDAAGRLETSQVRADFAAFLLPDDYEKIGTELRGSSAVRSVKRDGAYWRVSFRDKYVREKIAGPGGFFEVRGVVSWEADVDPVRRFMIDTSSQVQSPLVCSLDLETDSRVPFSRKEQARILNWSVTDFRTGEKFFDVLDEEDDESEALLLLSLFDVLDRFDLVAAWNGDRIDFPVLKARLERLRNVLPPGALRDALRRIDFRRWLWLDHMALFRKMNVSASESGDEKQSVALKRVWEGVVGGAEGKVEARGFGELAHLTVGGRYSYEFWRAGGENRELGCRYNVRDSEMMLEIEQKTGYIAKHVDVSKICGVFPDTRGMRAIRFVETFMMRLGHERGVRAPTKWSFDIGDDDGTQFDGAWVLPVEEVGFLRDVHVFDFSGMYPSIMISWNMSPETRAPEHDHHFAPDDPPSKMPPRPPPGISIAPITGKAFRTGVQGFIPAALIRLRELRANFEREREAAVPQSPEYVQADRGATCIKNIINSFYGATGSRFCRFFDVAVAESTTQVGVYLIRELTIPEAVLVGMNIIAADTDSGFARGASKEVMTALVAHCNKDVYPAFLSACGCQINVVKLAYEKELSLMVSVTKKRYAARIKHYKGKVAPTFGKDGKPSKPVVKGLEYMRGDWIKLARDLQKAVIDRLLFIGQDLPLAIDIKADDFRDLIEPLRDRVVSGQLEPRELTLSKSLSKPLDEYVRKVKDDGEDAALNLHVEVAHWMAKNGYDVGEGTRVEYVVTDGDCSPMKAVHIDEWKPGVEDRHYIWEKLVWPPTARVLRACFPHYRWDRYDESKPRNKGVGKTKVLAGQSQFDFLANDWGNGVPRGL